MVFVGDISIVFMGPINHPNLWLLVVYHTWDDRKKVINHPKVAQSSYCSATGDGLGSVFFFYLAMEN